MNNRLIQIYNNILDFDKAIENPKDFKKFNKNFIETNIYPLSETKEPELFECILKMINDHPNKYSHESNNHLTWDELDQITILFHNKNEDSYFKDFNPDGGDFSIIFKYLKNVEYLDNYCFYNCKNLTKINIPDSVIKIGDNCFDYCKKLIEINLPDFITEISYACFCNCQNLTEITIPDYVTKIDNYCFEDCKKLTKINLPNSIKKLGYACLNHCENLSKITIPDSVIEIGGCCFSNCKTLKEITIPKRFENYIFYNIDLYLLKVKINYI